MHLASSVDFLEFLTLWSYEFLKILGQYTMCTADSMLWVVLIYSCIKITQEFLIDHSFSLALHVVVVGTSFGIFNRE